MGHIKKADEFFDSEEDRKLLEERLKKQVKIKRTKDFDMENKDHDNESVDYETHFISSDDPILAANLKVLIGKLIKLAGHEMVYIGKTSNPEKRMTGKDMKLNESFKEIGMVLEVKDHIPPHDVPHIKNNYKKMYVLTKVDHLSEVNSLEKDLIKQFWGTNRNKTEGGDGEDGGAPYFIYVVIHEDSKIFNDTAS